MTTVSISEDRRTVEVLVDTTTVRKLNGSRRSITISAGESCTDVFMGPGSFDIVRASSQRNVVVVDRRISVVSVAQQGPPGVDGSSLPNLDTMIHPLYPISRREFEGGINGITKISVYSGIAGGVLLFERTISYDLDGRVSVVQTDNILNHDRLTKFIEYGVDGFISGVWREVTTWQ